MRTGIGLLLLILVGCGSPTDDPDPIIAYVHPYEGDRAGGERVTIATQGFADSFLDHLPEVRFDSFPVAATAISPGDLEVITPAHPGLGWVGVEVRSMGKMQSATLPQGFRYSTQVAILDVDPDYGSVGGGEMVTVTTSGFVDDFQVDLPTVFFGTSGVAAAIAIAPDAVQVVSPGSSRAGRINVEVRSTAFVQSATLTDAFFFFSPAPGQADFFGQTIALPSESVIYVLDKSNSMGWQSTPYVDRFGRLTTGSRWDRAADAAIRSIEALDPRVSFNVYAFNCAQEIFAPAMVPATPANKDAAEAFLLGLVFLGGTGTGQAGVAALQEKGNRTLLLVSDGPPNCGPSGTTAHRDMIHAENTQGAEIHTFGIAAAGAFRTFLEQVAADSGGTYTDVP